MKVIVNTISTKKNAGGAFQISQNFLLKSLEPVAYTHLTLPTT